MYCIRTIIKDIHNQPQEKMFRLYSMEDHKLDIWPETLVDSFRLTTLLLVQLASLRFNASHDCTYLNGWKSFSGGPTMDTNINTDKCLTVSLDLSGLHKIFILLKPLSHAAVLTGTVFRQLKSFCKGGVKSRPPLSL